MPIALPCDRKQRDKTDLRMAAPPVESARRWALAKGYEIKRVDGTESARPTRDVPEPPVPRLNVRAALAER